MFRLWRPLAEIFSGGSGALKSLHLASKARSSGMVVHPLRTPAGSKTPTPDRRMLGSALLVGSCRRQGVKAVSQDHDFQQALRLYIETPIS